MGGGLRGFGAAALVNGHVHQHRSRLPVLEHRLGDELGRRRTRNENAADHHVGLGAFILDGALGGIEGLHASAEARHQFFHAVGGLLDDGDISTQAQRHGRRIGAHHAAAKDHHLALGHAGHAAQKNAPAALGLFQAMRAGLHRHAPRHLAHGRQQRQAATGVGHGFIGNAHRAGLDQILGLRRIGRQVQVGVEDLALAQHGALLGLRLLHLHDHLGLGEDFGSGGNDLGPGLDVVGICRANAVARLGFHPDLVAMGNHFADRQRRQADAVFMVLDFLWHANEHGFLHYDLPENIAKFPQPAFNPGPKQRNN